jgi:arylsulfatase A-like enzyme
MKVSRRNFIEAAGASSLISQNGAAERKPPNILFVLADDHRADALGCMGNRIVQTPELDRLAQNGVIFENHFCTTPICSASRASIMLGQYAGTHGINDFKTPLSTQQVNQSYWQQLKAAGYHIGFIGKFGVGDKMPGEAFDYWKAFPGQGFYFPQGPSGPHLTHIMRDQANEFLVKAPRDRPFCLSISFKAPHVQDEDPAQYLPSNDTLSLYKDVTVPPPKGAGPEDVRRFPLAIQHSENRRRWGVRFATPDIYQASVKGYYRLVSGIDRAMGSIRAKLETLGLGDNTIIVYSADHGIFNGEHGFAGKWYGHEESIRIPLIVYDPRLAVESRGKRMGAMSLNIDLHPTVLDFAGIKAGPSTQGRSLLPAIRNGRAGDRSVWFFEHHFPNNGWIPSSEGIRTKRWKYLQYTDNAAPFEELYDLELDPSELRNLAGTSAWAKQHAALREYCKKWNASLRHAGAWKEPVGLAELEKDGLV